MKNIVILFLSIMLLSCSNDKNDTYDEFKPVSKIVLDAFSHELNVKKESFNISTKAEFEFLLNDYCTETDSGPPYLLCILRDSAIKEPNKNYLDYAYDICDQCNNKNDNENNLYISPIAVSSITNNSCQYWEYSDDKTKTYFALHIIYNDENGKWQPKEYWMSIKRLNGKHLEVETGLKKLNELGVNYAL